MSGPRRRRQQRRRSAGTTLNLLTLATPSLAENTAAGAVVTSILGKTSGSTLSLIDDAGGRFALSGASLLAGAVATDHESAASHAITLRETLAGATNSPRDNVLSVTVTDVDETLLAGLSLNGSTNTALKAMLADGTGRIVMKGDSTTVGAGAAIVSGTGDGTAQITNARPYRPSAVLASEMTAAGWATFDSGFVADNACGVAVAVYDPRIAWAADPMGMAHAQEYAGGGFYGVNDDQMLFTPDSQVTAFEVVALNVAAIMSFKVDGADATGLVAPGAVVASPHIGLPAGGGLTRITVPAGSLGTHTLTIYSGDESGSVLSSALGARATGIFITNQSAGAASSANQASAGSGWQNNDALGFDAPDLTIINLGLNDAAGSVSAGAYAANLQAIITKAKLSGDVLLASPHPASPTFAATANQTALRDAAAALAASNNVAYMDLFTYFGSWAAVASRTADNLVHPNRGMYAEMGEVYRRCIHAMAA